MVVSFEKKIFKFKKPSGTSRGVLLEKKSWFIRLELNGVVGVGECSVIPGLSPDYEDDKQYEAVLKKVSQQIELLINNLQLLKDYPSILFGMESAILDLMNGGKQVYFDNEFSKGNLRVPINGLIWMGDFEEMNNQIQQKIQEGYTCIKMKVGAIDFDQEVKLLESIRNKYSSKELILRVDANGAFNTSNVERNLQILNKLEIHSIEQPIMPKQIDLMADLCKKNIIPIALDEELIGVNILSEKKTLLEKINPQYIILKPSLHGGITGTREWVELAEKMNIGWWITSALESNIGLKCIAEFTAQFPINMHHGLGTGSLYENNVDTDLTIENGFIYETK